MHQDITVALGTNLTLSQVFTFAMDAAPEQFYLVQGSVFKVAKAFNESDQGGVPLTLTTTDATALSYASVSAPDGSFSFNVPAGEYNLAVGGGYAFESVPLAENPVTITTSGYVFATNINLVPTEGIFYKVSGLLNKTTTAFGEPTNAEVSVFLKDNGLVYPPQVTITDPTGYFEFKVPAGDYEIQIGGLYEFVSPPVIQTVSADYDYGTLDIRPTSQVGGSVSGLILPTGNPEGYNVRLVSQSATAYIDIEDTQPGTGNYFFENVPPDDYIVYVMPNKNGFYGTSALFTVNPGQNFVVPDINAVNVAPNITSIGYVDPMASTVILNGVRFESSPVNPINTRVFADGNWMQRPAAFTPTDILEQAIIADLAPGQHQLQIRKQWTHPDTSEVMVLSSNVWEFVKPLGQPTLPFVEDVTDTFVRFTWTNAPYAQQTEVEIWNMDFVPAPVLVGVTDMVSGTSYERDNLLPGTNYEIRIRNRAGSVFSSLQTQAFVTKSSANYQIAQFLLDNTAILGTILGFEVLNDNIYIAHSPSLAVNITRFNPDGSLAAPEVSIALSANLLADQVSLTSGGGKIFLAYFDPAINGMVVNAYNPDLSPAAGNNTYTFAGDTEGSLHFAGGKLFYAGTSFIASSIHQVVAFENPADLSVITTVESSGAAFNFNEIGYYTKVTADLENNLLLYVYPADSTQFVIRKVPLDNLTATPVDVAFIPTTIGTPDNIAVQQFKSAHGKIFMKLSGGVGTTGVSWSESTVLIDALSGYAERKLGVYESRGDFASDLHGRVWMAEISPLNNRSYFVQIGQDGSVQKSLPVLDFVSIYTGAPANFMNPPEFIKLDTNTGSMNFLHIDSSEARAIYRYSSDY
jgi:hypothetical protein